MICCLGLGSPVRAQDFLWVQHGGGAGGSAAHAIQTDEQGNTYVTGNFSGTLDLCGLTRTSYGAHDIFVAKFDPNGKPLWVEQAGGIFSETGEALVVDAQGNVYVTGTVSRQVKFGSSTTLLADLADPFIAKYSAEGQLRWVNTGSGPGFDQGYSLALDPAGTLYASGYYDNGIAFGNQRLTGGGGYLASFNQQGQAQQIQGLDDARPFNLAIGGDQQLYLAGSYSGAGSLIKAPVAAAGGRDVFVTKWNPVSRQVTWTKVMGSSQDDHVEGIALDEAGNCYVTGLAGGPLQWGSHRIGFYGGLSDMFLARLAPDGQVQWLKNAGGSDEDNALQVSYSKSGGVLVTGLFSGQATFSSNVVLSSQGKADVYTARYDANGNLGKVYHVKGIDKEKSMGITTDAAGTIWMAGTFGVTTQFGPLAITPPNNYTQFFVTKIGPGNPLANICTPGPAPSPSPSPVPDPIPSLPAPYRVNIPNIITPNADGKNDRFAIAIETDLPKQVNLNIYNRWGKKILEEKNYLNTWTGSLLPATVYYYTVEVVIDKSPPVVYKGWVELVR